MQLFLDSNISNYNALLASTAEIFVPSNAGRRTAVGGKISATSFFNDGVDSEAVKLTDWIEANISTGKIDFTSTVVATNFSTLPVHADNAAASGAGLATGRLYSTATGEVRVVV